MEDLCRKLMTRPPLSGAALEAEIRRDAEEIAALEGKTVEEVMEELMEL